MTTARALLPEFLSRYPFQPATGIWRAVEIAAVVAHGFPVGRGLDVGCGDGLLTRIVHDAAPGERIWVGIDPDPSEVRLAEATGLYETCHIAGGDALPFADNSFDFAFSNSVLEHIPGLEAVMRDVARTLKPGGRFIFTVPNDHFHDLLRGPLLPGASREAYLAMMDRRCAHVNYLSEADWRRMLEACGMEIRAIQPYLTREETQRWETVSRWTGGVLYHLFGKKRQPIEIQRRLGLRKQGMKWPMPLARLLARLIAPPLGAMPKGALGACYLVDAVKQ